MKNGSEKVVSILKEQHFDQLKQLESYQFIDENGKDAGTAIRHGVKSLLDCLSSDESLIEIRQDTLGSRKPADIAYNKNDHELAIQSYIKTIGFLEPSYVIMNYLKDAQKLPFLIPYLLELHKTQHANNDHTTILINCFIKLKKKAELNQFLYEEPYKSSYDVETAIKTLRPYLPNEALDLAKSNFKYYDHYFMIMIEGSSRCFEGPKLPETECRVYF